MLINKMIMQKFRNNTLLQITHQIIGIQVLIFHTGFLFCLAFFRDCRETNFGIVLWAIEGLSSVLVESMVSIRYILLALRVFQMLIWSMYLGLNNSSSFFFFLFDFYSIFFNLISHFFDQDGLDKSFSLLRSIVLKKNDFSFFTFSSLPILKLFPFSSLKLLLEVSYFLVRFLRMRDGCCFDKRLVDCDLFLLGDRQNYLQLFMNLIYFGCQKFALQVSAITLLKQDTFNLLCYFRYALFLSCIYASTKGLIGIKVRSLFLSSSVFMRLQMSLTLKYDFSSRISRK